MVMLSFACAKLAPNVKADIAARPAARANIVVFVCSSHFGLIFAALLSLVRRQLIIEREENDVVKCSICAHTIFLVFF